jgi:hypothetical protein
MQDAIQAARARLVEALESLRAILARGPEERFPFGIVYMGNRHPRAAEAWRAADAVLTALQGDSQPRQLLDEAIAPRVKLAEIQGFILNDVGLLDRLPVPPSIPRRLAEFIEDLGGRAPKRRAVLMIAEDELILATLADAYPAAVKQPDLEGLTGLSHQQISGRLQWLESKRYVKRPEGTKRKGHAITPAGLSAVGRPVEAPH